MTSSRPRMGWSTMPLAGPEHYTNRSIYITTPSWMQGYGLLPAGFSALAQNPRMLCGRENASSEPGLIFIHGDSLAATGSFVYLLINKYMRERYLIASRVGCRVRNKLSPQYMALASAIFTSPGLIKIFPEYITIARTH